MLQLDTPATDRLTGTGTHHTAFSPDWCARSAGNDPFLKRGVETGGRHGVIILAPVVPTTSCQLVRTGPREKGEQDSDMQT